ncbi:MAG TPA: PilZ domain-containing protein [Rhizomicrobium sp.]|nr:PilZ domain-containing protein [Rhizomicrobium sp.]
MSQPKAVAFPLRENRRQHERSAVKLGGQLFVPAEESEQPCQVVDLSAGGARVICEDVPPCATYVILYVDGFGRFPAVTTRYSDGAIGMRFDMSEHKREKLTAQIKAYLEAGLTGVTGLRRYKRVAEPARGTFLRANGEEVACSIGDFSLQGAFIQTDLRPRMGDEITLGHHKGRVVRHEPNGFAIQFRVTAGGHQEAQQGAQED